MGTRQGMTMPRQRDGARPARSLPSAKRRREAGAGSLQAERELAQRAEARELAEAMEWARAGRALALKALAAEVEQNI